VDAEHSCHVVDEGCNSTLLEECFEVEIKSDSKLNGIQRPDVDIAFII